MRFSFAVVLLLSGCVGPTAAAAPIVDGTPPLGDEAVVALHTRRVLCPSGHQAETFCSGVLIAPRVVLTAAHCLEGRRLDEIELYFGSDTLVTGTRERVVASRTHPAFDADTQANDLALLLLPNPAIQTPIVIDAPAVSEADVGGLVRLSGFGATGSVDPGSKVTGTAMIDSVADDLLTLSAAPALACRGDSGGAVFISRSGAEQLVALVRSGDATCSSFTEATRVDAYLDSFITSALTELEAMPLGPETGDPGTNFCSNTCDVDSDCPSGLRCLPERDGRHCGTAALRSGLYGESCASNDECSAGAVCAGWASGAEQECRCFVRCVDLPPPMSGGCSAAASHHSGPQASVTGWLLLLVWVFSFRTLFTNRTKRMRLS